MSNFTGELVAYNGEGKYVGNMTLLNGVPQTKELGDPCDQDTDSGDPNNGGNGDTNGDSGDTGTTTGTGDGTIFDVEQFCSPCTHDNHNPHPSACQHPICILALVTKSFDDNGKPYNPLRKKCDTDCTIDCEGEIDFDSCSCIPLDSGDDNPDTTINVNLQTILELNSYFGEGNTLTLEELLYFSLEHNTIILDRLAEFLGEFDTSEDIAWARELIDYLVSNNYEREVYTETDYPGIGTGLPFEWWEDPQIMLDSGYFNTQEFDGTAIVEQLPNAKELILFLMFQPAAILHKTNADQAITAAQVRAPSYSDSPPVTNSLNQGKADAFRHAYWNALGVADFGPWLMQQFADAHEWNTNDRLDSDMDLYNNNVGRTIAVEEFFNPLTGNVEISNRIHLAVLVGDLVYLPNGSGEGESYIPTNF